MCKKNKCALKKLIVGPLVNSGCGTNKLHNNRTILVQLCATSYANIANLLYLAWLVENFRVDHMDRLTSGIGGNLGKDIVKLQV